MARPGGAWIPDGRAKAIRADCEASLAALDGLADRPLPHPRARSADALAHVGARARPARRRGSRASASGSRTSTGAQLDEALELAPVAAVQVALSVLDDRALRGGVVERCEEAGVAVIAHSPLGGPRRAGGLARRRSSPRSPTRTARPPPRSRSPGSSSLSPRVVAIPGARRPETARSAARAARLVLDDGEREALSASSCRPRPARSPAGDGDVVLVMGIPGAGKSRVAEEHVARGYLRLNRDERGGSLRELADALDEQLASGARGSSSTTRTSPARRGAT